MARIRTLNFLPEIFQTDANREFLSATLDQIVNPPVTKRIQGYVGSRLGYGINPNDNYVVEPTKERAEYQLEPGIVFTNPSESIARDFISYPEILDSIDLQNGISKNNSNLFESQIYSWDSFVDLDKLINYHQYYWVAEGLPPVTVSNNTVFSSQNFVVVDLPNGYNIFEQGSVSSAVNPTLTLLRGGTYTFAVNQNEPFWIQGEPGVTGFSQTQPNLFTRNVLGVTNNGASQGLITFNVPSANAQDEFNFPNNASVDLVSNIPFADINGKRLSDLPNGIDGVTGLNNLTVMFFNTGVVNEIAYTGAYFDESTYDINLGIVSPIQATITQVDNNRLTLSGVPIDTFFVNDPITNQPIFASPTVTFSETTIGGIVPGQVYYVKAVFESTDEFTISETLGGPEVTLTNDTGSMPVTINQGLFEEGFYTPVDQNIYRIEFVGNPSDPVLRLVPNSLIPSNTRITPTFGTEFIGLGFFRNINGVVNQIPYLSAPLDILYYQDGSNPNKAGMIRIIDSNDVNVLNVNEEILGQKTFTSTNGVAFTNGLKVRFDGDVIPSSFLQGEYYVEGVGKSIELVPVSDLLVPERFTSGRFNPFSIDPYDATNYDIDLLIPIDKDYITIARNSISKNAWSRSNRWVHSDVITRTAEYNNNPSIITDFANEENKAVRPIIEFYPNLRLFQSGAIGKRPVDFYDTRQTDAFSNIVGSKAYYPDVEVYTGYTATINGVVNDTQTTITIDENDITGTFQPGMFVADTELVVPTNSRIETISGVGTGTLTITISWEFPQTVVTTNNVSIVGTSLVPSAFELFTGSRVIFSNDTDPDTKDKIFVVNIAETVAGQGPVITLVLDDDSEVVTDEQVVITRGFNFRGVSLFYNGIEWTRSQQKVTVNQAPLFDVFDDNGISFGDNDIYVGTSFLGNKLFAYGISDSTIDDSILGFPVRFSAIENIGDISFDISINLDTFDYVDGINPITQKVNTGYVHTYTAPGEFERLIGWQTSVAPSLQYQVFEFEFNSINQPTQLLCDIPMLSELGEMEWPRIKVFFNNEYQSPDNYTVNVRPDSTLITLNVTPDPAEETLIQVLLVSNETSDLAYYTVPINLSNNPFNSDITQANLGDIRLHYRDIFINANNIKGQMFGPNDFRDRGNLVGFGTQIIQNSASLALTGAFFRKQQHDLFNALLFNSREYTKFKQLLINTVETRDYEQRFSPSQILDDALDLINSSKSQINSFFWSDMVPSKAPTKTSVYNFVNGLDTTVYPLSKVYDFSRATYDSVLVYLFRNESGIVAERQLIKDRDYTISQDAPSLTITLDLEPGDRVVVKEYTQTYGSYVPNTPSKLGLYPAYEPGVVLDSDYLTPTYFIRGHDGSYTKIYGEFDPVRNLLVDFRDQALLEFERRIYNNIKVSNEIPIKQHEVEPGFFRTGGLSWEEFVRIYSPSFLNWVGQNRINYKTQLFNRNNEFTYNYTNSQNKLSLHPIDQGHWRGVYQYLYDTTTPHTTPWEMLGFDSQPEWWEARYGPAPYTSDNAILWGDLEQGLVWNNGDPFTIPDLSRPGLSRALPVDSAGNLVSPLNSIVGNFNPNTFQKDWQVGDMGPAELSYRRSSTWPFDLMRIIALVKPAKFFNLAVDMDNYRFNREFNQYLVNNRSHLNIADIEVYGDGTPKTSYINWIVDYEKQIGLSATEDLTNLLKNIDVRLVYRVAGFSDKSMLRFFVEKGSPNNESSSLLIPDESYSILLHDNQPEDRLMFSSLIVQKVTGGWAVFGNSQNIAFFPTLQPELNGSFVNIDIVGTRVKLAKNHTSKVVFVPYGTVMFSTQEVAQFIMNYAAWLVRRGVETNQIENGTEINWKLMVEEFLYWSQIGWENGSVINLNPSAAKLEINQDSLIVEPLTIQQQNFILNQNLYPISTNNLCVHRDGTRFTASPLNDGDSISYAQFNLSAYEHGIVFDNVTVFNDTIYNLVTGLRQNRVKVFGKVSAEWNGTVFASGFILNQDNVQEWNRSKKYTRGEIVRYKNRFYTSLVITGPANTFNEQDWVLVDYESIQKGLLPNASTRAFESTLYYDTNRANLENDADLLSYSLIGYRPRTYLSLADLTDTTQINVYRNLIKNKGTNNALLTFQGANLPQGTIQYDIFENWAIKSSEYGGVLGENFVDFTLRENLLTGNPSIVSLTDGDHTPGANQYVSINHLVNYGKVVTDPNILSTEPNESVENTYPSAGYVNFNDVKMASYFYSGLPTAVNASNIPVPIESFYVRDYLWLANFKERWGVYSWKPAGQVTRVTGNLNGTAIVTFDSPHSFKRFDPIAIINFAENVNGYYIVTDVPGLNQVTINLSIPNATNTTINGNGIALTFINQRVEKPSEIGNLDLLEAEFSKNTVWVDTNTDGSWAVYRKAINYVDAGKIVIPGSDTFGDQVAYDSRIGYLVSDSTKGEVYRLIKNTFTGGFSTIQTLTGDSSFGAKIAYGDNLFAISEPTSVSPVVNLYTLNRTPLSNALLNIQQIPAPGGVTDWGSEIEVSKDNNWIYISDFTNDEVHVYRKQNINLTAGFFNIGETYVITELGDTDFTLIGAVDNLVGITFVATGVGSGTGRATQVTYELSSIIAGSTGDKFGSSISTDYDGNTLLITAAERDLSPEIEAWGRAFAYQRTVQNVEVQSNSVPNQPQTFRLAWTPNNSNLSVLSTTAPDTVTLDDTSSLSVNDPIIFTGIGLGGTGVATNVVYYVGSISGGDITLKTDRSTLDVIDVDTSPTITGVTATPQSNPLYVYVNGTLVDDRNYATVNDQFLYTTPLRAGDIVTISDNQFTKVQEFNADTSDRTRIQFGFSSDMNKQGSEFVVGAPFEIINNSEGSVYRYVNGGAKYGMIMGTVPCDLTAPTDILLNGYLVRLPAGNAEDAANAINDEGLTNIEARAINGKLAITLVNKDLAQNNKKLTLTVFNPSVLQALGITLFTKAQILQNPHAEIPSRFGADLKIHDTSLAVSAPTGTRFVGTTFDFTDDENLDNDTVFDNNATRFVEGFANAGAVYVFDLLNNADESLAHPGKYVYGQSVNSDSMDYGIRPRYGQGLDFNENTIIVGSPGFRPTVEGGEVVIFENATGQRNWSVFRQPSDVVNINKINNAQLYNAETNETLVNLDYLDPLSGKLLGPVRSNLDFVSSVDPAKYNSDLSRISGLIWGQDQVGKTWFNTLNTRFLDYHQNDTVYNASNWGKVLPGSDVAVYTWVESSVIPAQYQGPGRPYNNELYVIGTKMNNAGLAVSVYYFWVRNTNTISRKIGKTLSDSTLERYIANPQNSGIAYFAPLLSNTVALYNIDEFLDANNTVFHIGFSTTKDDDILHTEHVLIRQDNPDDFLPGVPSLNRTGSTVDLSADVSAQFEPFGLYDRFLDSISGCDELGQIVPNPFLPKAKQTGILARPRQSFFFNRFTAVQNFLVFTNSVLQQFPISETRDTATFLFEQGEFFDTTLFWEYVNWWATGYDDNTKSQIQVPSFSDLLTLQVPSGTLVTVEQNGAGNSEVYIKDGSLDGWTRIGLERGTIRFKAELWDYESANYGFGGDFFDTALFDVYPSEETKNIIRAIVEQIFIDDLAIFRNKSLILLLEYIQSETIENQNYMPWLNKTSLVDVSQTIRELLPIENLRADNQEFLEGYIEETKPYHVVIKDYLFKYTCNDIFEGDITDFDLPAQYNPQQQRFVSPQLSYNSLTGPVEFGIDENIWQTQNYNQWFSNRGVNIEPQPNFNITTLGEFVSTNANVIVLDNVQGLPINGIIRVNNEEIAYSFVDRALSIIGGLTRGLNNTLVAEHLPGSEVFIDLPAVLVLEGGRGYSGPPRVRAVIDTSAFPEPIEEAELEAVMSIDSVVAVTVTNPGRGYAALPEIVIDPAFVLTFSDTNVNNTLHTLSLVTPTVRTGDICRYSTPTAGQGLTKLVDGQWYYVGVLETTPRTVIALYDSITKAVKDEDRIEFTIDGAVTGMTLSFGARATAVTSAYPVRENSMTLRFDRTTYTSQVVDWESSAFYGSFFAGNYLNIDAVSSSSIQLENTAPDIAEILASSQGVPFEITDVENERVLTWSSAIRNIIGITDDRIMIRPAVSTFIGDGNIVDTTLNITSINEGTVTIGGLIYGNGVDTNTFIISQLAGTPGGIGLYEVSTSQSVSPTQIGGYETNVQGSTNGFFTNMPIKFTGFMVGGLVNEQEYYVKDVISPLEFTLTDTPNGATLPLGNAELGVQTLNLFVGETVDTAILTINYPGIQEITETNGLVVTSPRSLIGTAGTNKFYTNLPVFFTGDVFGGMVENEIYYITTVIDDEKFTLSTKENPAVVEIKETISATDTVVAKTGFTFSQFSVNDPIIFTGDTFGGIVAGQIYYVRDKFGANEITLSTAVNGPLVTLADDTGECLVTNQKDCVVFESATGSATMNVSLPVSPGQVDGQLFTLYRTSQQFTNISANVTNLIERDVTATLASKNRIAINRVSGGTTNFYINMPIQLDEGIGGLVSNTTYYVVEYTGRESAPNMFVPEIQVTVVNTSGTILTCDTSFDPAPTDTLYEGMQITFSGLALGGLEISQPYFVCEIINDTQFTVAETLVDVAANNPITLSVDNGIMVGTGDPFIQVSASLGGSPEILIAETGTSPGENIATLSQFPDTIDPIFDVSYILGGYRVIIDEGRSGYAIGNTAVIPGTLLGGESPKNDLFMTVNEIGDNGEILDVIVSGTVPETSAQYYMRVIGPNKLAVYSDPLLTVPVSGLTLPYTGFTTTTVTDVQGTPTNPSFIVVDDSSQFAVNDGVVFTGNVVSSLERNKTYYIVSIVGNEIQLSDNPGNAPIILSTSGANFSMTKVGSYAFLPEPFYFTPSIVKHLGRLWVCIISNNDREFVIGKWEELQSSDRRLNALDRVVGYYEPDANMPGVDVTQLFDGVTDPNPTYKGNMFQPREQFDTDTLLRAQEFFPNNINLTSIVFDGGKYIATANLPTYSAIVGSVDNETWVIGKLTNSNINLSNISYNGELYVTTSRNPATPILRSEDGIAWSANGFYVQFGNTDNFSPLDLSSAQATLYSSTFNNGLWIAVGDTILSSNDSYVWTARAEFNPQLQYRLFDVEYITSTGFSGVVTVGKGKRFDFSTGVTELVDTGLIFNSTNGINWIQASSFTDSGLHSVASNGEVIVAVGENGTICFSQNASTWFGITETSVTSVNPVTNQINVGSTIGMDVDDEITFTQSFANIVAGTTYYVLTIGGPTQITISDTLGGPTFVVGDGPILTQTTLIIGDPSDRPSFNAITFAAGTWIVVGDAGTILTSTDAVTWTPSSSGTSENLNSITYNDATQTFTVVGENNAILASEDNGLTWTPSDLFVVDDPIYNIQSPAFDFGYGPEELVPGVVTDNLQLTVQCKPGSTWPVAEYGHYGFNVNSVLITPTSEIQTTYSFENVVQYPAHVSVQVIGENGTGVTLSETQYIVDWANKTVTLNTPLTVIPQQQLRIEVFEVGNGNQIEKSSTDVTPVIFNPTSEFNEIFLDCNLSEPSFAGSGVFRPNTRLVTTQVRKTESTTNRIFVDEVTNFVVNTPISFQGAVFGGIEENVTYFVKSVSTATNSITLSETFNTITGVAGPILELSNGVGNFTAQIRSSNGILWSEPFVARNGHRLVAGIRGLVTSSSSNTNAFTTSSTNGMVAGEKIVFCNGMFNSGVVPKTTYFVRHILNDTQFTVSNTLNGPVIPLLDATGVSLFITNDFAFAPQQIGRKARIQFAFGDFVQGQDYIVYSVFGETSPLQLGYSVPEVQEFVGNGSTAAFRLDNFVGFDNPNNAIVEIDGLRVLDSAYTIDFGTGMIMFTVPPSNGARIRVTTFNDTRNQYLNTNFNLAATPGSTLTSLEVVNTINSQFRYDEIVDAGNFLIGQEYVINVPGTTDFTLIGAADNNPGTLFTATGPGTGDGTAFVGYDASPFDAFLNWLVLGTGTTADLNIGDSIQFTGNPTMLGGLIEGRVYYVVDIWDSLRFVISETQGGSPVSLTTSSGSMTLDTLGVTVSPIINATNAITPPILTAAIETFHSTNEVLLNDVSNVIEGQTIQFRGTSFGGILTDGTVYVVNTVNSLTNRITIITNDGGSVALGNAVGNLIAIVGGTPTVRITTATPHALLTNDIVRLDNVRGSVQLNNNTYYVHVISPTVVDIYSAPLSFGITDINRPITIVSTYTGGGFIWRAGSFYLYDAVARGSSAGNIIVNDNKSLIIGTPVYFNRQGFANGDNIFGGIIQGKEYYIKNLTGADQFTISETRGGPVKIISDTSGVTVLVSQWKQVNTERVYVTVNGQRVPSSSLKFNDVNELSILTSINPSDSIIITSMISTATPNEETYINLVNNIGEGSVYRTTNANKTWLEQNVYDLTTSIRVGDARSLVTQLQQETIVPMLVDGHYQIGIVGDKNSILAVKVMNLTKNIFLNREDYRIIVEDLSPILKIIPSSQIEQGDQLLITIDQGGLALINGEMIRFTGVDLDTNTLLNVQRGVNGTAKQILLPRFTQVYGILEVDKLTDSLYNQVWNSAKLNPTLGDPLQLSYTEAARFLVSDNR